MYKHRFQHVSFLESPQSGIAQGSISKQSSGEGSVDGFG